MRVLIIGATGFTGSHLLKLLLARGENVRCLVRSTSNTDALSYQKAELALGSLEDSASLLKALNGMDAVITTASLGFGHAPGLASAIKASGVRRAIFVSTTSVFTSLNAPSKSIRLEAERVIRESGLEYTILRPTMIYGTSRDRNMCRLIRYLARWPVIPIFGRGECLQQPVYVEDVAAAIAACLETSTTVRKSYNISGLYPLSYNSVIDTICKLLRRRVTELHFPSQPITAGLAALEKLPLRLPVKSEQILRLNEDKAFDHQAASNDFGYRPLSFQTGIRLELQEMKMAMRENPKAKTEGDSRNTVATN